MPKRSRGHAARRRTTVLPRDALLRVRRHVERERELEMLVELQGSSALPVVHESLQLHDQNGRQRLDARSLQGGSLRTGTEMYTTFSEVGFAYLGRLYNTQVVMFSEYFRSYLTLFSFLRETGPPEYR